MNNKPRLIASLTCIESRKDYLYNVLNSLVNQSLKFDLINVYCQFNKEKVDNRILNLDTVNMIYVNNNYNAYNKYAHLNEEFTNDIVILCDDDIEYNKEYSKNLMDGYVKNKDCLICNCFNEVKLTDHNIRWNSPVFTYETKNKYIKPLTGWGTLIPPNFFDDTDLYKKLDFAIENMPTDDEPWMYINCLKYNKYIYCIGAYKDKFNKSICLHTKNFKDALYNINVVKQYKYNDICFEFLKN